MWLSLVVTRRKRSWQAAPGQSRKAVMGAVVPGEEDWSSPLARPVRHAALSGSPGPPAPPPHWLRALSVPGGGRGLAAPPPGALGPQAGPVVTGQLVGAGGRRDGDRGLGGRTGRAGVRASDRASERAPGDTLWVVSAAGAVTHGGQRLPTLESHVFLDRPADKGFPTRLGWRRRGRGGERAVGSPMRGRESSSDFSDFGMESRASHWSTMPVLL